MATNSAINTGKPIEVTKGGIGVATLTDHGVLVGSGTGAITPLAVGTDGQVLIAATGADPAFATLTSSGGTVTFTPGANSLNLEAAPGGMDWSEVTGTTQAMANGEGYIANNATELINFTLPATSALGDVIAVAGNGIGKYLIFQNSGQTIHVDTESTTTGEFGCLGADNQYSCLELVCSVANTDYVVRNYVGSFETNNYVPLTWTSRTSGFSSSNIRSVACSNSLCVIVGNDGKLATATDPTGTWTLGTSSFGTTTINSVAYDSSTYWVTVGNNGKLATATDPTGTWTQRTSSFGSTYIFGVDYGNGVWTIVGTSGKLATATDPTGTWTQRTSSFGSTKINCVAYGNGVWVAGGDDGKLATATDPTGTWTQRTSQFGTIDINSVAYGNGYWTIVGYDGKLATATDPTGTWTLGTSQFGTTDIFGVGSSKYISWVTGGDDGKLATATDPTGTWTLGTSQFGSDIIFDVAFNQNGIWIAVGVSGKLSTGE